MASAKKCDRCGTLYDTPRITGKLSTYPCTFNFSEIELSIEGSHNTVTFDLCNDCAKKYIEFLKGDKSSGRKQA